MIAAVLLALQAQTGAIPASSPPLVTAPKLIAAPVMAYPVEALLHHEEGRTTVRIEVDAQGRVARCTVVSSSGSSSLDKATCTGLKQWQYAPALDGGGKGARTTVQRSIVWRLPVVPVVSVAPAAISSDNPR